MRDANDKQEKKHAPAKARSAQREIESKSRDLHQSLSDHARDESVNGIGLTSSLKPDERLEDAQQRMRKQSQQSIPLYPDRFPGAFGRRSYHTFSFVHTPAGGIISVATTPEALSALPPVPKPPSSPNPLELANDTSNNFTFQKTTPDVKNLSVSDADRKVRTKAGNEFLITQLFFLSRLLLRKLNLPRLRIF